jgi:putative addiction module CopG family antidote
MEVHLTAEQQAFVHRAVKSGRYRSAEDAVCDAMTRWAEEERARAEMVAAIDEGANDLDTGAYRDYTDSTLSQLASELKSEGRAFRTALTPTKS